MFVGLVDIFMKAALVEGGGRGEGTVKKKKKFPIVFPGYLFSVQKSSSISCASSLCASCTRRREGNCGDCSVIQSSRQFSIPSVLLCCL